MSASTAFPSRFVGKSVLKKTAVELRMGGGPASAQILWVDGVAGLW